MKLEIRLTRYLYDEILNDLNKPHAHAAERIGFLSAKIGNLSNTSKLIIFTKYLSIPDQNYIYDPEVGARIDGIAIRAARQHILDSKEGVFHVHIHKHLFQGCLGFSTTDEEGLPRLIDSFKVVGPNSVHGAILFGQGKYTSLVWLPKHDRPLRASKMSIIGYPLHFMRKA